MLFMVNITKAFITAFVTLIMFAFFVITIMNLFSVNSNVHAFSHPMKPMVTTYSYDLPHWINNDVFNDNKLPYYKKESLEKYKFDIGYNEKTNKFKVVEKKVYDKVIKPTDKFAKKYDYDEEFDYDIPRWVYKKVFRHNKTNYKRYNS